MHHPFRRNPCPLKSPLNSKKGEEFPTQPVWRVGLVTCCHQPGAPYRDSHSPHVRHHLAVKILTWWPSLGWKRDPFQWRIVGDLQLKNPKVSDLWITGGGISKNKFRSKIGEDDLIFFCKNFRLKCLVSIHPTIRSMYIKLWPACFTGSFWTNQSYSTEPHLLPQALVVDIYKGQSPRKKHTRTAPRSCWKLPSGGVLRQ